jgi:hypothetical protein
MAGKGTTCKCVSMVVLEQPVETHPLTPRIYKIDGRTIHISICGEPNITIAPEKRLKTDYPNGTWIKKSLRATNQRSSRPEPTTISSSAARHQRGSAG